MKHFANNCFYLSTVSGCQSPGEAHLRELTVYTVLSVSQPLCILYNNYSVIVLYVCTLRHHLQSEKEEEIIYTERSLYV